LAEEAITENYLYYDSEDCDGDDEDTDIEEEPEEWSPHDNYGYRKFLNKSYDNGVYTGYADGIKVGELDQEANWQFQKLSLK